MKKILFISAFIFALALAMPETVQAFTTTIESPPDEWGCTLINFTPAHNVAGPGSEVIPNAYVYNCPDATTPTTTTPPTSTATPSGTTGAGSGSPQYQAQTGTDCAGGAISSECLPQVQVQAHASDPTSGVQCGNAGTGGALSTAAQGAGLGNTEKCLASVGMNAAGNIIQGGSTSGAASGALSCLTGLLGGVGGGIVQQCLSGQCDGKTIANALLAYGFQRFAQPIKDAIMKQLGSVLSKSTTSAISDAISHAGISGISNFQDFTNVAGAITGGGEVPVIDKTVNKTVDTHGTQNDTDNALLIKKTCVYDPTFDQLSKAALNRINAKTIEEGAKHIVVNHADLVTKTQDSVVRAYLDKQKDDPSPQSFQATLTSWITDEYSTKGGAVDHSKCAEVAGESALERFDRVAVHPGCNFLGSYALALSELSASESSAVESVKTAVDQGNGFEPTVVHTDHKTGQKTPCTSIADCPEDYEITVPGFTVAESVQHATNSGVEQLQNAKHVGEKVNPFVANLVNQLFSRLYGFIGLAISSGGNPSYLDQISGSTDSASVETAKNYLVSAIEGDITSENHYQSVLADMLGNLNGARNAYDAVRQCYIALSTKTVLGVSTADITARADLASSTMKTLFDPQIVQRTDEFNDSRAVTDELGRLKVQTEQATTAEEINAVSDALDSLQAAGLIHSSTDISFLVSDANASAEALTVATTEAETQLAECQALSP
jgi:hypothetical protein